MNTDLSIVVPLYDEEESLPELIAWIERVTTPMQISYEVLLVDDGSKDGSWHVIQRLKAEYPFVQGIRFRRNYGKSAALNVGFAAARGNVVITMDADLQDSPDEVPELYRMIAQDGFDLVSGWKKKRHDPLSKTIPSKFFNWVTRKITGIELHDFNCGLKAYRGRVVKGIEVYGEMHRYIPFLAKDAGFQRIGEKVVEHRARKYGHTKFGWERFVRGFLDLLSLTFVLRFKRSPMYFFGTYGILAMLLGTLITVWLVGQKLYVNNIEHRQLDRPITDHWLFFVALVMFIVGVQLFLAGFLAELVGRSSGDRNNYLIDERV